MIVYGNKTDHQGGSDLYIYYLFINHIFSYLIHIWFDINSPLMCVPIFFSFLTKVSSTVTIHNRLHKCHPLQANIYTMMTGIQNETTC